MMIFHVSFPRIENSIKKYCGKLKFSENKQMTFSTSALSHHQKSDATGIIKIYISCNSFLFSRKKCNCRFVNFIVKC